jgi:hypothetical protein
MKPMRTRNKATEAVSPKKDHTSSIFIFYIIIIIKGKVHSRTGHKGPEGVYRYTPTSFKLDARKGWVVNTTPRPLYPGKDTESIV